MVWLFRFLDDLLGLLLRRHEEDLLALGHHAAEELRRLVDQLDGLGQVDDVDAVALVEDVAFHLRVPALGLVAEMQAGLDEVLELDEMGHCQVLPL